MVILLFGNFLQKLAATVDDRVSKHLISRVLFVPFWEEYTQNLLARVVGVEAEETTYLEGHLVCMLQRDAPCNDLVVAAECLL